MLIQGILALASLLKQVLDLLQLLFSGLLGFEFLREGYNDGLETPDFQLLLRLNRLVLDSSVDCR